MAIQPDGDRVLFTNIDADPARRAEFWTLVEEHERTAGADQMSCRFADREDFWAAVVQRNDCPPALRDQYASAEHDKIVRFDIESGKAMRKFLRQQNGWDAEGGDDQTAAKFHDGRAGRTQYRIVGELPNEVPMVGKVALLRSFTEEFRRHRIPFVAVMHAPDHNNDEKNWHFHLVYYDRPCARITAAQIAELGRDGHDTDGLAPGMWDFTAATVKKDRVNRELFPLRQKKVSKVGNDRWIKDLRHRFAAMTNIQLETADVARRVDPRRHVDMGIVADPQEHLGTRQAAAETRGTFTAAGTRNEERQSQAILAQIDQAHANAVADARHRVADWQCRLTGESAGDGTDPVEEIERNLIAAADLDHLAARLRHADDRATSRAINLKRVNGQLVQAIDADASAGSRRERRLRADIVTGADRYLHILDVALRDDRRLTVDCVAEAGLLREAARLAETKLEERANTPAMAPKSIIESVVPPPTIDPVEQWLRQVEQRRPLIVNDGRRFALAGVKPPTDIGTAHVQAKLAALYRRQQDDIAHVVRQLPAHCLSLGKRQIEGRSRYCLDGVDPELAKAFFRYQDSPEIKAAVDAVVRPELCALSPVVGKPAPAPHRPVAIAKKIAAPVTAPQPPPALEAGQVTPAPSAPSPPPVTPPALPVTPIAKAPARAPAVPPPTPAPYRAPSLPTPAPDPAEVARDLVARKVPLTLDAEYRVDRAGLMAAKVDARIIGALQNNAFLAGRAGLQVDQALAELQAYARANPANLIRKGEQITLGNDTPAALIELSRFHARAPLMQERLRRLHDELNKPAEQAPVVTPAKDSLQQSIKVAPTPSVKPTQPANADILHGEAASQAALRAAWQRNR